MGFGAVGSGVFALLGRNSELIYESSGVHTRVRHILVRDPAKPRQIPFPRDLVRTDLQDILNDPEIDIVVETMRCPPHTAQAAFSTRVMLCAPENTWVSANKQILALHCPALKESANAHGVMLRYEAAV